MIQIVRVIQKEEKEDHKGIELFNRIENPQISKVRSVKVYRLEGVSKRDARVLSEKLLSESINQSYFIDKNPFDGKLTKIEVAYKPGVMNPEVGSFLKSANDLGIKLIAADSSCEYIFFGKLQNEEFEKLRIYNPLIEYIVDKEPKTLLISGAVGPTKIIKIRLMDDIELSELSKDKLFLNLEEMIVIQSYFQKIKRDPTDCELETLAQTWSEHCAHKTFKANLIIDGKKKTPLIKRIKEEALKHDKNIVSAFVDNSGVMKFYDGYAICGKVETHNSPSAIEPYGGAMTGSGGVIRDILGTGIGAKVIASTDMFCFANPGLSKSLLPLGSLPPEYLLKRVVAGVRDYGNRVGVPTNNGSIHFHDDFRAKPSVIVGAYGIMKESQAKKRKPKKGEVVVIVGGRTGRDGVHGATFSSAEMTDKTILINSAAVQIGNAIEEKRMMDAILEARDKGLIKAITDCGAGGFSSAIGEMGESVGVSVDLSKAPLKYHGISPWEIWVSESQERMVMSVEKDNTKKLFEIFKKYNVEGAVLGKFTGDKNLKVYFGKKLICNLPMEFLHHGLPQRTMMGNASEYKLSDKEPTIPANEDEWIKIFKKVLEHGNVNSKEPIVRLYDHSVQATNDLQSYSGEKLDGPNDAVVLRPFADKKYGMIIAHGMNPVLNNIDPYEGSVWAALEAMSNYVAVGGDISEASLINNYIWPFPDEESLWKLDRSVDAVVEVMKVMKIPVISGKDSLSSTYRGKDGKVIKIPPVLCISVFGKIPDTVNSITSDFKNTNSVICLVGNISNKLGGSTYFDVNHLLGDQVSTMDLQEFKKNASGLHKGIQKGAILSVHDVSEGGIISAVFDMCVGGDCGADIVLKTKTRADYFLFNETAGTFVVEVENIKTAKELFKNIPFKIIGETKVEKTINVSADKKIFSADLYELKKAWQKPMRKLFP